MKKLKFITSITCAFLAVIISFTSCEAESDEITEQVKLSEQQDPMSPNQEPETSNEENLKAPMYENVKRYYYPSGTLHSYKVRYSGSALGNYEGIAFSIPFLRNINEEYDKARYHTLFFLKHPSKRDYLLSTNGREINRLISRGWKNETFGRPLIQKRSGNGMKPLYRFYSAQQSDHLFTKNYTEGVNAGYRYEGITGYVR